MDARQFLAEFGHIASAPEGVQWLREMIYNLAITGDLTQQFPEDGDAQTLLEKIGVARQRLICTKQFKRTAKLESEPLQVPGNITLPNSWRWTRLLDLGEINPRNEAIDADIAAFIPMSGMPQSHKGNLVSEARTWGEIKKGFTHFANGDVAVAKITPCFENGKAAVIAGLDNPRGIGAGTTELHVFRPIHHEVLPAYVYIFLRSPFFAVEGECNMTGTAGQKRLPTEYFATRATPLPPFAEQERIVAKVDELMALCDKLEAQQREELWLREQARRTVFRQLADASSGFELRKAWGRIESALTKLLVKPDDVDDLRQIILELAVTGRLTAHIEQLDAAIVERMQARKRELAAKKIVKRETPTTDFPGIEEMLQVIPDQWVWCRLNDIASVVRGGSPRPAGDSKFYGGDIPFLKVADVTRSVGMFVEGHSATITEAGLNKTREIVKRTVLLTNSGATLGVPGICTFRTTFNDGIAAFIELNEAVFDEYLYFYLKSRTRWLQDIASRGQGQPNLNTDIIRSMWFPLPPLSEQHEIVGRIKKLFRICDVLAAQLSKANVVAKAFVIAASATITGIRPAEEEEPLKTPKTELVSRLHLLNSPSTKEQAPLAAILARHRDEMAAGELWKLFGGDIDTFYAQLKLEIAKGWIAEPGVAEMREVEAD